MALLPTCGRFYTFYNIKWTYCISLAVFELGSIISAVAPNSMALIIGRAVSGLGAAGLVSGTTTIMSYCVPLKKQAKISPIVLGMYGIGSAVGPLVGGSITDNKVLTWRFVFWINLRKFPFVKKHPDFDFYSSVLSSFRGGWTGSRFVHPEEPSTRRKGKTTLDAEVTSARYSRRYSTARCDVVSKPGSAMGWHCLSMVQRTCVRLPDRIRFTLDCLLIFASPG